MFKHTEEFKREAVRIALTSGLPRERVATDLGVGKSTLHNREAARTPVVQPLCARVFDPDRRTFG